MIKPDVSNPPLSEEATNALNKKFDEWVTKGYIRILKPTEPAIFHPISVIPKRNGGHRPILNLSWTQYVSERWNSGCFSSMCASDDQKSYGPSL